MGLHNFYFIIQLIVLVCTLVFLQIVRKKTSRDSIFAKIQQALILLYSYFFLFTANWKFCICVAAVSLIAYATGMLINKSGTEKHRKHWAMRGGILLLLMLGYFKYTNFFIESMNHALGLSLKTQKLLLSLGISFFTFSALSYVIDVYQRKCDVEKNVFDFSLYMVFFPKIIAGPIVRWIDFKPQLKSYRGIELPAFHDGIQIFVFGLFKKIVLADHLGVFVDDVFLAPGAFNTGTVWLSAISYTLQIYLDFSGYSDMAIGLAKILGFEFKPNFNLPYIAKGFSDFWERWHISLSQWFRDYLYIPLGGSRNGKVRTYVNLMIVMIISGLWHGAGWTFILWGTLHGIASCVTRLVRKKADRPHKDTAILEAIEIIVTFIVVTLFWSVFRAENIEKAGQYWKALFTIHNGISQPYTWTFIAIGCVLLATLAAITRDKKKGLGEKINGFYPILNLNKIGSLTIFFTVCGLIVLLGYFGNTAFIYGGF